MAKWCTKGVKAPFWLEHILAETHGGRIPVLAEGSKYHFFICKQDGNGPFSGKNLAYGKYFKRRRASAIAYMESTVVIVIVIFISWFFC